MALGNMDKCFQRFFGALLIAAFVAPSAVFASEAGTSGPSLQWKNSKYRNCGQSCDYKKANEVISVDSLYTIEKVDRIEKASDAEVFENLREFCLKGESAGDCRSRYKEIAYQHLQKSASAIKYNKKSADALYAGKGERTVYDERGNEGRPQVTMVATPMELNAQYQSQQNKLKRLIRNDYSEVVNVHEPALDEFVLFKSIPRNPGSPGGETMTVLDTSCGKAMCYDMAAFKKAKVEYEGKKNVMLQEIGVATTPADQYSAPRRLDDQGVGALSVEAYKEARGLAIDAATKAATGKKKDVNRSTAGTAGKPGASRYTGSEQVPTVKSGDNVFVTMEPEQIKKEAAAIKRK